MPSRASPRDPSSPTGRPATAAPSSLTGQPPQSSPPLNSSTISSSPSLKVGFKDKKLCMKENISKGFSGIGSPTGSQRLTPLRETLIGQRASVAKICEEVGLQKILQLPSEDTDIQIHAVKVVANLAAEAAAKHLTPFLLELGGKCLVVDSDINLQVTSRRIIAGKWGCNNGQVCISPD